MVNLFLVAPFLAIALGSCIGLEVGLGKLGVRVDFARAVVRALVTKWILRLPARHRPAERMLLYRVRGRRGRFWNVVMFQLRSGAVPPGVGDRTVFNGRFRADGVFVAHTGINTTTRSTFQADHLLLKSSQNFPRLLITLLLGLVWMFLVMLAGLV